MAKMRMFLRDSNVGREPLAVSMSSVRASERVLQIGVDDPAIVGAIAAKVGLTGLSTIVVPNEAAAARARSGSGDSSVQGDVRIEPLHRLPFDNDLYDAAVIHSAEGLLASLDAQTRSALLVECRRVLRVGGRIVVLEAGKPAGLRGIFSGGPKRDPQYEAAGGSIGALEKAGFATVRVLGDQQGYRFIEGLRGRTP